jgi:phospholipase C
MIEMLKNAFDSFWLRIKFINTSTLIFVFLSALFAFSYFSVNISSQVSSGVVADSEIKSNTPIKHIIVISQGKRTFDNYFGTFPGANGLPANLTVPLNPFPQPLLKFTVDAWFKTNNTFSKTAFLVNKGGIGVDTPGKNMNFGVWMNSRGNVEGGFENKNGTDYTVSSNKTYNDGKWHNAAITYNGNSELNLFLDGNLSDTTRTEGAIPDFTVTQPVRIGSNSLHPDNYFKGSIDEVRVWNRNLENSEISKGYYSNNFDNRGQLVYLPFKDSDTKSNATISNSSKSGSVVLNGIYLNGTSYRDADVNSLQGTKSLKPYNLDKTKTDAPFDSSKAYKISYNRGKMDGFLIAQISNGADPNLVMGYYNDKQLPYYWKLASEFVLADNFFAPTMETGLANQVFLYTAAPAEYQKNASFRGYINLNKTIFDELQAHSVPWKVYVQNYDPALNYTNPEVSKNRFINLLPAIPRFVDNKTLNSNIVDLVNYFRDLRSGNFPAVSYIVAPDADESSPRDASSGQVFASSLVLALMKSNYWNDSAFIITYRESGGWYDHVAPPTIDGQLYGFRLPTLIVSPFAKPGYVDPVLYDVTSILKFIESNYGLPALSTRDAKANNMLNAFNFTQPPTKPLQLISNEIQNATKENGAAIHKYGESIYLVNLVYIVVLCLIPVIGIVIWILPRWRGKLNVIQGGKRQQ